MQSVGTASSRHWSEPAHTRAILLVRTQPLSLPEVTAMRITAQIDYPGTPQEVGAMLADPEYLRSRVTLGGAKLEQADVVGEAAGAFTATTRGRVPSTTIPQQVRGSVGDSLEIRQVEAWQAADSSGRRIGTVVIEISGAPVRLTGTRRITPPSDATTCPDDIASGLKASIPLLGH